MSRLARFARARFVCLGLLAALAAAPAAAQEGEEPSQQQDWFRMNQPEFFRMPPFNLPVIREGRVTGQVSLLVTIETQGIANKEKVLEKHYTLQNAFLQDLHGVVSLATNSGRPLVAATVKRRLQRVADRVMGKGIVKGILIENVYNRALN